MIGSVELRQDSARADLASSSLTLRLFSRSYLFPAIVIVISVPTILRSSLTHFRTLLNDSSQQSSKIE